MCKKEKTGKKVTPNFFPLPIITSRSRRRFLAFELFCLRAPWRSPGTMPAWAEVICSLTPSVWVIETNVRKIFLFCIIEIRVFPPLRIMLGTEEAKRVECHRLDF